MKLSTIVSASLCCTQLSTGHSTSGHDAGRIQSAQFGAAQTEETRAIEAAAERNFILRFGKSEESRTGFIAKIWKQRNNSVPLVEGVTWVRVAVENAEHIVKRLQYHGFISFPAHRVQQVARLNLGWN